MSRTEQPVSERIKILLDSRASGNKSELGRAAGISGQGIADLIGGKKGGPSFAVLQNILRSYPDLSERWLIFGEGEMLKTLPQDTEALKDLSYMPAGLFPKEAPLPGFTPAATTEVQGQLIQTRLPPGMGTPKPAPKQLQGQDFIETVARHEEELQRLAQQLAELKERVEKG